MNMRARLFRNSMFFVALICMGLQPNSAQSTPPAPDLTKPAVDSAHNAAQAKYVIQRTIEALGGNKYLNATDLKITGRGYGFYQNEPQGEGSRFTRYVHFPDKDRFEYN